jgi:hypothetical protein
MSRTNQYRVTLAVNGADWGVWDGFDGGEVDSDDNTYRPGGMARAKSLGGTVTVGNVTLNRNYELERDHLAVKTLINLAGKARVVVKKQPLDIDGNVYGDPLVYTGTLKRVTPPTVDSTSDDPAMIEVEITCDGAIS